MLKVTHRAVARLKAEKLSQGMPPETGIRIMEKISEISKDTRKAGMAVAFADGPASDDEEIEQDGLRIFVQDTLVEPLDGSTLDVREDPDKGPQYVILR